MMFADIQFQSGFQCHNDLLFSCVHPAIFVCRNMSGTHCIVVSYRVEYSGGQRNGSAAIRSADIVHHTNSIRDSVDRVRVALYAFQDQFYSGISSHNIYSYIIVLHCACKYYWF